MCVELQCEQGLTCMGGMCIPEAVGTGSTTSTPTTDPTGVTTNDTSTTAATTNSGSTSSTTTSVDGSSTGEPTGASGGESSSSTTAAGVCGDFNLDDDEECDQDNFCTDCELDNHGCNPLNNHPCPDDRKCSFTVVSTDPFEANYTCVLREEMPLGVDEADCFVDGDAADQACEDGLGCLNASTLDNCPDGQACCTEYCNLELPKEMQCTNPAYTCEHEDFVLPGLEMLGICRL